MATLYWWVALAVAFLLAAILVSAAVAFNGVDVTHPVTLWGFVLIANPFLALAVRHIYRARFDRVRNLTFLASGVLFLPVLHTAVMLYLDT